MGLYSFAYYVFMAVSAAVLFVGGVLIWLPSLVLDRDKRLLHLYSCFWGQLYFQVHPLWRLRVQGREKLPWRGGAVLVANHQSLGDILVLFGLYRPFKWVSKASVFRLPFIGWNMWLNDYVGLVRGDKASITRMMAECKEWLARGVPVLLFPEGTRSRDGELGAFKDGAFRLACECEVPVFPIAVAGTGDTLPKHGFRVTLRSDCRVQILDPLLPSAFGGQVEALRDACRERIAEAKAGLDRDRASGPARQAQANG